MMSTQPLTPSSNHLEPNKWREITKLAEQLLVQPDIESQLISIIKDFEQILRCTAKLWLAEPFSSQGITELLQSENCYVSSLSELMQKAYDGRGIFPKIEPYTGEDLPTAIAVPLITGNKVLGVVQLERRDPPGFNHEEIDLTHGFSLISSMTLYREYQREICTDQEKNIELLTSAVQLSKSITSNLDEAGLINSTITSIHQRFGIAQVRLFTFEEGNKEVLSCTGISNTGIEPPHICEYQRENSPVAWSITHHVLVVVNDTALENRFAPSPFDEQTKSELAIPLVSGETFLGALDLCSEVANAFKPYTMQAFMLLADNISVAIRNSRLYHSELLRRRIGERVREVIGEISADISLDEVLDDLLVELERALPCEVTAIWLTENITSDAEIIQPAASLKIATVRIADEASTDGTQAFMNHIKIKEQLSQYEDDPDHLHSTFPWLIEIASSKEPIIRKENSPLEPLGKVLGLPEGYSAIGIPLHIDDRFLGIIIGVNHLPEKYASEAQLIASTFANYASVGIANTELYTATHDQVWLSTALLQVAETTRSATSLGEMLDTIAGIIPDLAEATGCTIYLWDPSMGVLYPQVSYGYEVEQQDRLNAWEIQSGTVILVDQLIETKTPVILNRDNLADDIATLIFPAYDLQTDLLILFPMMADDEVLGAILVDFSNTAFGKNSSQKMWDDKYMLIQGVIDQTTPAIENLQRLRLQEEEAYISIALLQVAQAIVSLNQLDDILASIVRITPILVGIKRCVIYLWDDEAKVLHLAQQYGFSKTDLQMTGQAIRLNEFPFIETIVDRNLIAYYQLEAHKSPSEWSEVKPEDLKLIESVLADGEDQISIKLDDKTIREKDRLLIGFPLSVKNEVLGVMLIEEEDPVKGAPSYHIREKRVEIVNGITQQAAMAIKNELLQQEAVKSERMERELQLAREIQATFLPDHIPELPGWELDAHWQPAREVGGDFYDILLLGMNRMGFVIADVADKGMPAAMFMTLIRTLIRAAAKDNISPARVLTQVNELLIPDAKHGMFVTVVYAVFELNTGRIVFANAGHNPPVIKHTQSDELVELTRTSVALGLFDDIKVDEREVTMNPGDWLLFYTDGVTEAFSRNEEMFGKNRLFDLLSSQTFTSCDELLSMIENKVQDFIEGLDLSDDVTLAAIHRI